MDRRTAFAAAAAFAAGCASGALVAWAAVRERYRRIADEEIASMKEHLAEKHANEQRGAASEEERMDEGSPAEPDDWDAYISEARPYHAKTVEERQKCAPRVIDEREFGELDDYTIVCLTYFSDGVLCDELNQPVEDPGSTVGQGVLDGMASGSLPDLVFVRNDRLACDFEVAADVRRYRDVADDRSQAKGRP